MLKLLEVTPLCIMCLTHPCHFSKKKNKGPSTKKCNVTLIGVRIMLGLIFEVSTLHQNAAVHPFDPFLKEGVPNTSCVMAADHCV